MITPLGSAISAPVAPAKVGGTAKAAPAKAVSATSSSETSRVASPALTMAEAGPPVDAAKVARIKAGLADGSYKADPQAIARAMLVLDLAPRV